MCNCTTTYVDDTEKINYLDIPPWWREAMKISASRRIKEKYQNKLGKIEDKIGFIE